MFNKKSCKIIYYSFYKEDKLCYTHKCYTFKEGIKLSQAIQKEKRRIENLFPGCNIKIEEKVEINNKI